MTPRFLTEVLGSINVSATLNGKLPNLLTQYDDWMVINQPGKSTVHFFPMIDLKPTDMTCIYSTLKFVCKQASLHGFTPIITFDQPLWMKALTIRASKLKEDDLQSVVLRLGGLHILIASHSIHIASLGVLVS